MHAPTGSLAVRLLHRLAGAVFHYPRLFLYPQLLLCAFAVWFTKENLEFSTSRNDLVGSDKKYHTNFLNFQREFTGQDDLVAVVESEDKEKNRQFVERLGVRLEAETNLFRDVFYKGDLKMMGPKALLFLPEETLAELHRSLEEYRPFLDDFSTATNLNSLFRQINSQFRTARREASEENESMIKAIPALTRVVRQATASLERPGSAPSPGISALFDADQESEEQQYITFNGGTIYIASARALKPEFNGAAVERLRELVRQVQAEVPGVNVGITGEPVLEFDEMRQSQIDSTRASIISLVAVAIIFIVGYREVTRPLKATFCLVVGLCYTMGYATWVVGHLNILTVTFLPILIGLAIDFGVHLITRYEEELRRGTHKRKAMEKAMVNTGIGLFTGCFTTAGAFFAMGLTDFKGIQEMGIITGGGLVICLIPMMTLLPMLLLREKAPHTPHAPHKTHRDRRGQIEKIWLKRPVPVVVSTGVLCILALLEFRNVYFDYNLLNMQSRGLPAVVFEEKLINSAGRSVLYAAVIASSLEEAVALEEKLERLPTVASVDSMASYLMEDQRKKLEQIGAIKEELKGLEFAPIDPDPVDLAEFNQTLTFTQGYLGLAAAEVLKEGERELRDELLELRAAIGELRNRMLSGNRERNAERLTAFRNALFQDLRQTFHALQTQDNRSRLRVEDLPSALRNRFIGRTGLHLLQVYPKRNVWERENQEPFVRELRTVDPDVTGTPVQLYEYTGLLRESYQEAAGYALVAIVILVLLQFRSFAAVVLALIPVAVGMIWMTGMMGWLGVPFNPANIMTLPLVIGIGVTNGIHILTRFKEEQNPSILAKSTGKAVLVSGLTTIAGFGSLIPAEHEGISSLGVLMTMGVGTCMVAGLTVLPTVLTWLMRSGWSIRKPSGSHAHAPLGREEPR